MTTTTSDFAGIYRIRNEQTGRVYIGSSRHVNRRLTQHRQKLLRGSHINVELQADFKRYGARSFSFIAVERIFGEPRTAELERALHEAEDRHIKATASAYNVARDARRWCEHEPTVLERHGIGIADYLRALRDAAMDAGQDDDGEALAEIEAQVACVRTYLQQLDERIRRVEATLRKG